MAFDEFRTPSRHEVDAEFNVVAEHLGEMRPYSDFDDYIDKAQNNDIPLDVAALALRNCSGDFSAAAAELKIPF